MINPFVDARIRAVQASHVEYEHEPAMRGDPAYVVRSHCLGEILRNAARWVSGYKSPDSKAKGYGSMFDCLVLVPEQWDKRYVMRPDTYPAPAKHPKVKSGELREGDALDWNANAGYCKDWAAKHKGLEPVSMEQQAEAIMAFSVLTSTKAKGIIASGPHQVWVEATYVDKATGRRVPVKGLIDIAPNGDSALYGEYLFDLKTTRNASPGNFRRECCKYNYDLQAAFYLDLFNAASPESPRITFAHIVQENFPPYATRIPILSSRFLERGRLRYRHALALYARAQETGQWPDYDPPGTDWPITEPEEWMLDQVLVYPGLGDIDEEEDEQPELAEVIP